ncbi:MAG TPA: flagellar biosynthetic protein FliQ [Planctomycetota bacterium]|nr:flagellar biosynthetic protein FliQ [Planctomycetota bacterium]
MGNGSIETLVLQVTRQALILTILLSGIPIVLSMIVGVIVSVFQAATQIQEQTLTFVPKLVVVLGTIMVGGYWMIAQLVKFTATLFAMIPKLGAM